MLQDYYQIIYIPARDKCVCIYLLVIFINNIYNIYNVYFIFEKIVYFLIEVFWIEVWSTWFSYYVSHVI